MYILIRLDSYNNHYIGIPYIRGSTLEENGIYSYLYNIKCLNDGNASLKKQMTRAIPEFNCIIAYVYKYCYNILHDAMF